MTSFESIAHLDRQMGESIVDDSGNVYRAPLELIEASFLAKEIINLQNRLTNGQQAVFTDGEPYRFPGTGKAYSRVEDKDVHIRVDNLSQNLGSRIVINEGRGSIRNTYRWTATMQGIKDEIFSCSDSFYHPQPFLSAENLDRLLSILQSVLEHEKIKRHPQQEDDGA